MKNKWMKIASVFLAVFTVALALPACQKITAADSYMAIVPGILHIGRAEAVSLSLLSNGKPVTDIVDVVLLKDGKKVTNTSQTVSGTGTVTLNIPKNAAEGKYEVMVKGTGFTDKAPVSLEKTDMVFLETDKPIYKPGQTINMRVLTLDADLKPLTETATIEVLDAKGIKIFRTDVTTDDYGMASLELPVSTEPNLGTWKITAATEKSKNEVDVQVDEYVLPKYEVTVDLPKQWFLVSEPITGKIKAEYSFGKPVSGELKIEALKYVGQWQTYATITKSIDGEAAFELPAPGYVAGTPAGDGQGNVQLNITVTEKATGYLEKTSSLLTVAQSFMNLQLIPDSSVFKPGLPFSFLVVTETPDNKPVDASIANTITYSNSKFEVIRTDNKTIKTTKGKAILNITPPGDAIALTIEAMELTLSASAPIAQASKALQS